MPKPLVEKVSPRDAALIVVDVQNDFCHSDGATHKNGADVAPMQAVPPVLNGLIDAARKADLPVVWVRTTHSPTTDSPSWNERREGREHYICADGSWGAEWFQVAPAPGEDVVLKHRYSGFVGTNLDDVLRARGIKSVIVTGVVTNMCVESTVRDAFMRDYFVVVPRDCVAASEPEVHERSLDHMGKVFGDIATAAQIIACWTPQAVEVAPQAS